MLVYIFSEIALSYKKTVLMLKKFQEKEEVKNVSF